jgi:hypothetical protein
MSREGKEHEMGVREKKSSSVIKENRNSIFDKCWLYTENN